MRHVVVLMFSTLAFPAWGQEQMLKLGQAAVAEMAPLQTCLKTEVSKAKSNDEARTSAQSSCQDVAAVVREKVTGVIRTTLNPVPQTFDVDKAADGMLNMVRLKAYYDFTGELERFRSRQQERDKR
jgi:hypothetical protein